MQEAEQRRKQDEEVKRQQQLQLVSNTAMLFCSCLSLPLSLVQ